MYYWASKESNSYYVDKNQKYNLKRIATPVNNFINQEVIIKKQIESENNGVIL